MGLRALNEELADVLGEARGDGRSSSDCGSCGNLAEVLRQLAEESGLTPEAIEEAVKCSSECRAKYMNENGSFKAESACQEMFKECCKGVKDPRALCGYIGRKAGKI